jgi:hypothetical protein
MAEPVVSRRAWLAGLVSGATLFVAACGSPGATVLDTPEGRVMQYEGDDLLVLVSGLQPSYHLGDTIHLTLLVKTDDAQSVDQDLQLTRDLLPGDYALTVEVPPWKLDGRDFGHGAILRAPVRVDPAVSE